MLKVVDKQGIVVIKQVVIVEIITTTKECIFAIYSIWYVNETNQFETSLRRLIGT